LSRTRVQPCSEFFLVSIAISSPTRFAVVPGALAMTRTYFFEKASSIETAPTVSKGYFEGNIIAPSAEGYKAFVVRMAPGIWTK
jgi:hypothetical protein